MRYLENYVTNDLKKKMVFIGGPRQCGKTTLARNVLSKQSGRYLNWDDDHDQRIILNKSWLDDEKLIVLDEIHKYKNWKNFVKGIFDKQKQDHSFLITGSARLDLYQRGGDSLLGRYHYWRLHPFTIDERPANMTIKEAFDRLMSVGGFPEPFLDGNIQEAKRWRRERLIHIIREDIRDLSFVKDLNTLELFYKVLRTRVGSGISLTNIANDLQIAPKTARTWLDILNTMYITFDISPYTEKLSRTLQKQPKIYFYDTADIEGDEGAKFENLVATHLLKRLHFLEDATGVSYQLNYIRDKEKHEVDFLIQKENEPIALIECKWSNPKIAVGLNYFAKKLNIKHNIQLIGEGLQAPYQTGKIKVFDAKEILNQIEHILPLE